MRECLTEKGVSGKKVFKNELVYFSDTVVGIKLKKGVHSLIDSSDVKKIEPYRWILYPKMNRAMLYCRHMRERNKKRTIISLHRLIMNAKKGQIIDHVNHNGLDNRKANLRFCSLSENRRNCVKRKECSSKYKGVYFDSCRKKYQAMLYKGKKWFYLGRFSSELEAAKAYNFAAIRHFGDFANLNNLEVG